MKVPPWFHGLTTLRGKFLAIVLPLVVLCFLLFSLIFGYFSHRSMWRKQRETVEEFTQVQSEIMALPLWNLDLPFIERHVKSLALYPWVSRIEVKEFGVGAAFEIGELPEGIDPDAYIKVERAINIERKEKRFLIGRLTVYSTTDVIYSALFGSLLRDAFLVLLLALAVTASAVIANRMTIGIPLDRFLDAIRRADRKDERPPVQWASDDELGRVIHAYNGLLETLDQREKSLKESEEKYRNIFQRVAEGIYRSSPDGRFLEANPAMAHLFGFDDPEQLLREVTDIGRQLFVKAEDRDRMIEMLDREGAVYNHHLEMRRKSGETIWVEISARAVRDDHGRIAYIEGLAGDITERKFCEIDLQRRARLDELTRIPNRFSFREQLGIALSQSRNTGEKLALLYLDLDRFKRINDTAGHAAGDQVIREAAQRIKARIRRSDMVARVGGDEFCVVVRSLVEPEEAGMVAEKIIEGLRDPFQLDSRTFTVGASIGISLHPRDGATQHDLIEKADQAMFKAKNQGRNRYCFWG